MTIWVDGDACPVAIREIVYRAGERTRTSVVVVANSGIRIPRSKYVRFLSVAPGLDMADTAIVSKLAPGDLVITGDIPLAAEVVKRGGVGLDHRGTIYTKENVAERLGTRDFHDTLRSAGVEISGPAPFSSRDKQSFANSLDQLLARGCR